MGAELGRISGPLLSANLVRHGVNLWFADTDLTVPVLYLDVVNGRIGINNDAPSRTLQINGGTKTNRLIVDTQADIDDFTIVSNSIQYPVGNIYLTPDQLTDPAITTPGLGTSNLRLWSNTIENITLDSDINISPTGRTYFSTVSVNISGNLHATGDITWDGNITLGDENTDSVVINAEVTSDLLPDADNFYSLGNQLAKWSHLYSTSVTVDSLFVPALTINGINLALRQGNIFYVAVNGNDTYVGDHQHAPFKTVKMALSQATAGDTVFIYPGTYQEEFPLTVPAGVTVTGESLRSVKIVPTLATNNQDAFLINGESTVENLTVADFYYNASANTGYGFRFATNSKVVSRSPYIRNVSVLTQNVDTPSAGIDTAGRGALVDGSVVALDSNEAAMLFHSVTMIVPNADGITVTNGARVEWLNSFTYFANIGIHLIRGTLGFASLGVKFNTEMRSINSANVYGNYGAIADGAGTLAYLIGHNFAYIGSALNSQNDARLSIQANEVVESNTGKIYYESVDHKGDYRIGNIFYVNQETGQVIFDAQSINFGADGNITLEGPTSTTIINKDLVQTGNIRISGNNIDSLIGPTNFLAASGSTYLNTNVFVTGKLNVTQNVLVKGTVYFGDTPLDTITIVPNLTQTISPKTDATYTLGSTGVNAKLWDEVFLNGTFDVSGSFTAGSINSVSGFFEVPNIKINSNQLFVTTTDTDLNLLANGTGGVRLENIKFVNNTISNYWPSATTDTQKSIIFSPNGTGNTTVDSTKSLVFPVGNTSNRTLSTVGEVRYNNTTNLFEGWAPSGLVSFNSIWDSDRNTFVTAELTPGNNDNTIRFGINGVVKGTITSTALYNNNFLVDNVSITGNVVSNAVTANDLIIEPTGTGSVNINGILVKDNNITNNTNSSITLASTGTGYIKFGGTGAVVLPAGVNADRRPLPDLGEVRYNTEIGYMEVWNGSNWIPAIGTLGAAPLNDVLEIMDTWSLILG